jgi:hypothetical protein
MHKRRAAPVEHSKLTPCVTHYAYISFESLVCTVTTAGTYCIAAGIIHAIYIIVRH